MWKRDQEAQTDVTLCHDMKVDWNCEPMIKEWSFTGHWTYDIEKEKFIAPSLAWCAPVPPEDVGEDGRPLREAWATPGCEGWNTLKDDKDDDRERTVTGSPAAPPPPQVDSNGSPTIDDEDEDDEDVALTIGEAAARFKQNMTPDSEGFCECTPEDVELCVVEIKERRFRLKRGLTADSGAGDPVIPRRMINGKKITVSAGQKRGLHYVSATDHRIPNLGEIKLEFETVEGFDESIVFQVAEVNKALMSISDRVDHHCRVVFDQDETTGEDLSHIFDKKSKRKMRLRRVGKVWVLDCTVTKEFITESSSVFSRPGP